MIKKTAAVLAAGALLLSGCASVPKTDGKINVICTVFPQYDWTKQLIKGAEEKYELTLLTENGVDIHSYQPSAEDIIKIKSGDLLIYTGGESDAWLDEYAGDIKSINMLEVVGNDALIDKQENEADEHTWLSIDNAEDFCERIAAQLALLDAENAALYAKNKELYEHELDMLDDEYEREIDAASYKTAVVADRFPFRYLFDEYDIKYFAAFPGCSAETEASFETVKLLTEKAEEAPAVIVTDNGNRRLAETVISNTSDKAKPIVSLNSMQSIKREDIDAGATYVSVMRDNLAALKEVLKK